MEMSSIEMDEKLKKIFVNYLKLDDSNSEIMLEDYHFNSVDTLKLLIEIENEFLIEIPDENLNDTLLQSMVTLKQFIETCLENN